ncbi:MAG: hypothetical protein ABIT38_24755, partial [Gemmatimonadaceae bacterium]
MMATIQTPDERASGSVRTTPSPATTSGNEKRDSAMLELTLARVREFIREPEAVFWTLIFPILMASGLGIAFR